MGRLALVGAIALLAACGRTPTAPPIKRPVRCQPMGPGAWFIVYDLVTHRKVDSVYAVLDTVAIVCS